MTMQGKGAKTLLLRICQERIMHIWMVKMAYKHAHTSQTCVEKIKGKEKGAILPMITSILNA
jgi:hypothetical protein